MPYTTTQDLIDAYSEDQVRSWSDSAQGAEINEGVVTKARASAHSKVNSYLSVRYAVPVSSPQSDVKDAEVAITAWLLAQSPGFVLTDEIKERYKDAVKWLQDVSAGRANIDAPLAQTPSAQQTGSYSAEERTFTHDTLKGL